MAPSAPDGASPSPTRVRLAVAAIFKNEGPYINEWVAHHRALGIERLFIADNASSDETTATLAALAAAGIVDHLPFPTPPGRGPQQAAYEKIMSRYGGEADWIAFLDGDEFLVPAAPHRTLAGVIAALAPAEDVGSIVVNWALYGSSGHKAAGSGPVAARFTRRAEDNHPVNRHYKSIVRPAAYAGKVQNPHYLPMKDGFRAVHADGSAVTDVPKLPKGLSGEIVWDPIRINHYVIKSWDEFYYRKRARGRATGATKQRDEAFFKVHDRNEVVDPMPAWLVAAAAEESRRIEARLRAGPSSKGGAKGGSKSVGTLAAWKAQLAGLLGPAPDQGVVESVEVVGDSALIRGWALTPARAGAESFAVALDRRPAAITSLVRTRRSDVLLRLPDASAECGFNLRIALPAGTGASAAQAGGVKAGGVKAGAALPPLTVTARYDGGKTFALPPPAPAAWRFIDGAEQPATPAKPAPRVPNKPSMPPEAIERLTAAIREAACYLEYGSGGSTVLAESLGVATLIAVESDKDWLQLVRARLGLAAETDADADADTGRRFLLHADIGPTKSLGYPASAATWAKFHTYPMVPWDLCRARGLAPDLVLVDGRFRAACFLATLLFARPGCVILFDDYSDRPFYHTVEAFGRPFRMIGRMAEFRLPEGLAGGPERDRVWETLYRAIADPR